MPDDQWTELSVRIEELKRKIDALQAQQEGLAENITELVKTFRSLAVHMGIATDTYRPGSGGKGASSKAKEPPPGFA